MGSSNNDHAHVNGKGSSRNMSPELTGVEPRPYKVEVSLRFIWLSLAASILLAFSIGRAARIILIEGPKKALSAPHDQSAMYVRPDYHEVKGRKRALPSPVLMDGKEVPHTLYTSKNFDTAASATVSSLYLERNISPKSDIDGNAADGNSVDVCTSTDDGEKQCIRSKNLSNQEDEKDDEEEEHLPAGQHLIVDIKNVDGDFLNSEERLAQAMLDVVNESKLTLLSYHCHSLVPVGVSCVGVLLESHISFHTWPEDGVITLDLFTCGSGLLVPVLPIIKNLFAIPQEVGEGEDADETVMIWSHKLRGFRPNESKNYLSVDLGIDFLEKMTFDMKKEIAVAETDFQRIDIYDIIDSRIRDYASYERSLSNDGSYEAKNPELFAPSRHVFLDGVLQSNRYGNEAYHEALVHPAMFAHPNPRRAAIIGGGECATLREVLKHKTIEKVKMIEIDEEMVNVSREFLPDWSDCSDLHGSADWCGDDKRADLFYEDALAWFMNRFSDDKIDSDEFKEDLFDIIIMDALDPQDDVPFAKALYQNDDFLRALYESLSDDGIIVFQLGMSPSANDPPEDHSREKNRAYMTALVEQVGFESVHIYYEPHCFFGGPWTFLVAMKNYSTRGLWYQTTAELEIAMHDRLLRTHSGKSPLNYFDSATMKQYQIPSKDFEGVYCKKDPIPTSCLELRSFSEKQNNVPASDLEVKISSNGRTSGRGVYSRVDIKKGESIAAEQSSTNLYFKPSTVSCIHLMEQNEEFGRLLGNVTDYIDGYGWQTKLKGKSDFSVKTSVMTFSNHGCKGMYNIGALKEMTEENFNPEEVEEFHFYDPVRDRHIPSIMNANEHANQDIKAGEEILCNYVEYSSDNADDEAARLKAICNNEEL